MGKINGQGYACGDRVLVKLKSAEKVSAGGIVFVDDTVERNKYATQEAYIIQIGAEVANTEPGWCANPWYKVGNLVKIFKYSGEDFTEIEDGELYRVINYDDVLFVWKNKDYEDKDLLRHFND
jgi:co-chaperonin GroES (HSP10)